MTQLPAYEALMKQLGEDVGALEARAMRRRTTTVDAVDGAWVTVDGRRLISWSSNDYLGLASHPALAEAAARAARELGVGARASRLLVGTTRWHAQLETALASWFGAERALVYPSGYLTNLGVLATLFGPDDLLLLDRAVHASLVDAARASRATVRVFRHNDAAHARALLVRATNARRRCLVTEGVFSMDGDRAPLAELASIAEAHGALLYIDDAHGAFVIGAHGRGSPEAAGVSHDRVIYMATLGKALGCQGGFIAGPVPLIDSLINRSKTFIYSTALATPIAAAACAALEVATREPQLRDRLAGHSETLWRALRQEELTPLAAPSHIIPVIVGTPALAVTLSAQLLEQGMWAPAIRPPTVPQGTARIRLSVSAAHTPEMIARLTTLLREAHPAVLPA